MIKEDIIKYCNSLELDTVGFIKCRRFDELIEFYNYRKEMALENEFEEADIEKRVNPMWYMEEGKTIISIAFPYLWVENNIENGFSKYTKGFDYHRVVKKYLDRICDFIKSNGGEAISFVDSNTLPERYIAYLSGVGFIGRNNMIITEKYGSYVFLGEIITDLELADDDVRRFENIKKYKECGKCTRCYKECPTKSININRINPNICSSYITQKKELSDVEIKLLKNKVFGCDISIKFSKLEEFKPLEFMCNLSSDIYADMNNKFFKDNISKTSCGWRGKNVIKRNAIIKLHNEGEDISRYRGDSPYINEYIDRLK